MNAAVIAAAGGCAALMGYAIQRGATCTVAAVDELVSQRRSTRLRAMAEASLWVALGLLLARAAGMLPALPPGFVPSGWTIAGALLLGLGAFVNRACVFGAIARLGSGEWAYAATPLGFFAGCLLMAPVTAWVNPQPLVQAAPALAVSARVPPLPLVLGAFVLWRGLRALRQRAWSPAAATTVIGLTFLAMVLLVGTWAYTDALAELAQGMARSSGARLAFFACLLGGAMLGGWHAGRWRPCWPAYGEWLRCFTGGAAMAAGSALIPGSNDGLLLVGMPLLWPYAWIAFLTMCAAIAAALWLRRLGERRAAPSISSTPPPKGQQP